MTNVEQNILYGEATFKRVVERLMDLPGRVEVGRTSDTHDKYVSWYPVEFHDYGGERTPGPEHRIYIQWIIMGDWHQEEVRGNIEMQSNLTFADKIK